MSIQETNKQDKQDTFGLIFHWGPYCVPAFDSFAPRKIYNGSEWYLKRLLDAESDNKFRPVSGHQETKKFHDQNYPGKTYDYFRTCFKEIKLNSNTIDGWCSLAKKVNASYVILTSKHHDGFCLWPTKHTKGDCSNVDYIKEFSDCAKKYGLLFGIYYSWMEFEQSMTISYLDNIVKPQMKELRKYKPDIWWFDGSWVCKTKYSLEFMKNICNKLKKDNPNVQINDRVGDSDNGTYLVVKDRYMPDDKPNKPWEHINTIGNSWGYNKYQTIFKTGQELLKLYKQVKEYDGKFLLNLGPDEKGNLDKREVDKLLEFYELKSKVDEKSTYEINGKKSNEKNEKEKSKEKSEINGKKSNEKNEKNEKDKSKEKSEINGKKSNEKSKDKNKKNKSIKVVIDDKKRDCQIKIIKKWIPRDEADKLCDKYKQTIKFEQHEVSMYGKPIMQPRQIYACGNDGLVHKYSGLELKVHPWIKEVKEHADMISKQFGFPTNACLLNEYKDGKQYVGWHADKELNKKYPHVYTLSLGSSRYFYIQDKKSKETIKIKLKSGDLVCMTGNTQKHYKHSIPKLEKCDNEKIGYRISETFRILPKPTKQED